MNIPIRKCITVIPPSLPLVTQQRGGEGRGGEGRGGEGRRGEGRRGEGRGLSTLSTNQNLCDRGA